MILQGICIYPLVEIYVKKEERRKSDVRPVMDGRTISWLADGCMHTYALKACQIRRPAALRDKGRWSAGVGSGAGDGRWGGYLCIATGRTGRMDMRAPCPMDGFCFVLII